MVTVCIGVGSKGAGAGRVDQALIQTPVYRIGEPLPGGNIGHAGRGSGIGDLILT